MSYAIIGFGKIGQALAHAFARRNIKVVVASRHPPEALAALWQTEDHAAAARLEAFIKTLPPAKKRALAAGEAAPEALFSEKLNGRAYLRRTDEEPRLNALLDALRGTDAG